jgi:hypothetical protein
MRKNMYYKHENKAVEEILGCKEGWSWELKIGP